MRYLHPMEISMVSMSPLDGGGWLGAGGGGWWWLVVAGGGHGSSPLSMPHSKGRSSHRLSLDNLLIRLE